MYIYKYYIICITLYNYRQADRFYDGDIYLDPTESDRDPGVTGIENNLIQSQPLRSRENIYDYRDTNGGGSSGGGGGGNYTKSEKSSLPDATLSIRSPSSLTHTTKTGSQNSIRSGISLKDSTTAPSTIVQKSKEIDHNAIKYTERLVETDPKGGKYDNGKNMKNLNNNNNNKSSRENLTNSNNNIIIENKAIIQQPVPTVRNKLPTKTTSKTHLIEGIPQTEV